MMHQAWCGIGEVPYCFSKSTVKFQGQTGQKSPILTRIGRFQTVIPVLNHRWLRNNAESLKYHRRDVLLFFKVIRQIPRSHRTQIRRFWPEFGISGLEPGLASELISGYEMMHKTWSNIEEVPIVFQGHSSNFKVTWYKNNRKFLPDLSVSRKWLILKPVSYFPHKCTTYEPFTARNAHSAAYVSVDFHMLTFTLLYK